jgi:hypothetical protein
MPYDIVRLRSPSHPTSLIVKRTASKATVQFKEGSRLHGKAFVLLVGLEKPYQPRMWVEADESGHHAAMVAILTRVIAECY